MSDRMFPALSEITVDEVRSLLETDEPFVLLDVRQPVEYAEAHLPGATLLPLSELEARLGELDPENPVVAYCHVGGRSLAAAHFMAGRGFTSVMSLRGGIDAWSGEIASGPFEWGFELIEADADPVAAAAVALALEEGLGRFYAAAAERVEAARPKALLGELASMEHGHADKVRALLIDLGGADAPDLGDRLEGAFRAEDLTDHADRFAGSLSGLLGLAMMVECQAMDLYLRLAARSTDEATADIWQELATDERIHLRRLATTIDYESGTVPYSK